MGVLSFWIFIFSDFDEFNIHLNKFLGISGVLPSLVQFVTPNSQSAQNVTEEQTEETGKTLQL